MSQLYERIIRTAEKLHGYHLDNPKTSLSETLTEYCDVFNGYAVLHLSSKLTDTTGIMLKVGNTVYREEEVFFEGYDEVARTIIVRADDKILYHMENSPVSVVTDMDFLVVAVKNFFSAYGEMLSIPEDPESTEPQFSSVASPDESQRLAAEGVCRHGVSYIWGAPGTGKTQVVLSSCIRGCLENGEKIAVFAPTNNSVEQVLNGLLKSFGDEVPDGIIRLGIPSAELLSAHPEMCEDRQAQRRYDRCEKQIRILTEVSHEIVFDAVRPDLNALISAKIVDEGGFDGCQELSDSYLRIKRACEFSPTADAIIRDREKPLYERAELIKHCLYDRERPWTKIKEYQGINPEELWDKILAYYEEKKSLEHATTAGMISSAKLILSTPHQFISRFRPHGSPEDARIEFDVDRIFLDEAGYCGLVQALSLFTNGVPVAMFGDHMQLPPVEQIDDDISKRSAEERGELEDVFLWNLPAIYAENLFTDGVGCLRQSYLDGIPPMFVHTFRHNLTVSKRFGSNLAGILDTHVYRNGLTGDTKSELEIMVIDVRCDDKNDRYNPPEAEAVAEWLRRERPNPNAVSVLTPYTKQRGILKKKVDTLYADCVMTVHASQGREWDTVLLSVADNRTAVRDSPYRFTSSATPIGLRLMNTAVSRAKKRLILVCDAEFWISKNGELIGALAKAGKRLKINPRRCSELPGFCATGP